MIRQRGHSEHTRRIDYAAVGHELLSYFHNETTGYGYEQLSRAQAHLFGALFVIACMDEPPERRIELARKAVRYACDFAEGRVTR